MADETLVAKVQELSDLELAALICLTTEEHCIIRCEPDALDDVTQELGLIASNVFGLSHSVVDCSEHISLDDFVAAVFEAGSRGLPSPVQTARPPRDSYFYHTQAMLTMSASSPRSPRSPPPPTSDNAAADGSSSSGNSSRRVANVVVARNLHRASSPVQIQALELMRTRRVYSRTAVHAAPKRFLFVALLADAAGPDEGFELSKHVVDHLFISHVHDSEDGFPNVEDLEGDGDSISSVVKKPTSVYPREPNVDPFISVAEIEELKQLGAQVVTSIEVKRHIQNVITFLRMHRFFAGGASPLATRHFDKLVKCLASLHGLNYVTPSIVALAARKIYLHRILVVKAENERSLQWGSDLGAVKMALQGVGPSDIMEDVLGMVEEPL